MELEDLENLIYLGVTHEEGTLLDQLSEDTSDGPHVHTKGVLLLAEEDLGGSVPESLDLVGQCLDGNRECSGETKVADLDVALGVDQKILGLQVSVDDPLGMAVVNSTEQLVEHLLDSLLVHGPLVLPHVLLQIVLDIFKNQIELLLVWLEDDLLEARNQ